MHTYIYMYVCICLFVYWLTDRDSPLGGQPTRLARLDLYLSRNLYLSPLNLYLSPLNLSLSPVGFSPRSVFEPQSLFEPQS